MATLIVSVLLGLGIAFFATQNTAVISVHFLNYVIPNIPVYVVIVGALLVGLCFSWILNFINNIATGFTIRGKDGKIKDFKKENAELTRRIHQLELQNTKLMAETHSPADEKSL